MRLSDLVAVATSQEQSRLASLVSEVNCTRRPYPKHRTVPQIFAERAAQAPDATAIVCGPVTLTYGTLAQRTDQLARALCEHGVAAEQPIAILLPRSAATIVAMLSSLKAGGAYLPLSPDLPAERLRHILHESRAPVIIADAMGAGRVGELVSDINPRPPVITVDPAGRVPRLTATAAPIDRSTPGSLAYIMYTSGTTGVPKGVMVEHHAILRLVINTDFIELGRCDGILQTGSLSFDASTFEVWGALLNGARLVLPDNNAWLGARGFADLVRKHAVTVVWLTAGVLNALATEDATAFAGLRVLLTGGEKLSPHHINMVKRAHPDLVLINGYGPTENTTFTTTFAIRRTFDTDIPIGRPIANTTIHILDEQRRLVPIGAIGELYAGGDGLARGYLSDCELTNARFVAHPFEPGQRLYRTGDLVRLTADGIVKYLGRADGQIKIRGFRVEPAEVEAALLSHRAVTQAIAIAQPDPGGDQRLIGYYTATRSVSGSELRQHLLQLLPGYMVPAAFVQLSELPLNANGKVDRAALPPAVAPSRGNDDATAVSDSEATLLAIWGEVLGRTDIGTEDSFFDLGGHSMLAIKLAYRIEQRFGVLLPLTALFEAPTVAGLAKLLVDAVRFGDHRIDQPRVKFNANAPDRLVFAFPPGTADALSYAGLAELIDTRPLCAFSFTAAETDIQSFADLIEGEDPDGPYLLFGYSGGGNFAFRTARELEARGRRVSAVVMLDSSRFVRSFGFPPEEARALALEFVGNEEVMSYLRNPALKDKVIRNIERYHSALGEATDEGTIDAAIHLVLCESSVDAFRDEDGHLVCSKSAWGEATLGPFRTWQGVGDHRRMLHRPHLNANAAMLAKIFRDCSR